MMPVKKHSAQRMPSVVIGLKKGCSRIHGTLFIVSVSLFVVDKVIISTYSYVGNLSLLNVRILKHPAFIDSVSIIDHWLSEYHADKYFSRATDRDLV